MWLPGIVVHDVNLFLPHHEAAEVLRVLDRLLVHHAQVAGLVVGAEELVAAAHLMHVAPAAAIHRFQKAVLADHPENALPVERKFQVAHRPVCGSVGMLLMRQDHGGRHGHAKAAGQRVVEKFVVGRTPEGIVDYDVPFRTACFRSAR